MDTGKSWSIAIVGFHRGRSSGRQQFPGLVEPLAVPLLLVTRLETDDQPIGRGDPDGRGAANREPADGPGHILGLAAVEPGLLPGQPGLIEQLEPALAPADR